MSGPLPVGSDPTPVPTTSTTSKTGDESRPGGRHDGPWRGRGPAVPILPEQLTDKVMARVFARLVTDPSGCLIWTGATTSSGYGQVRLDGRMVQVHRLMWVYATGRPVPDGLTLDHGCRTRACANPAHLEAVTHRENILRGESFAADHATRTHCPRGHALIEGNLVPASLRRGDRQCLVCNREQTAEQQRLIRAAARSLGLSQSEYGARYGWSAVTAREVLDRVVEPGQLTLDGIAS